MNTAILRTLALAVAATTALAAAAGCTTGQTQAPWPPLPAASSTAPPSTPPADPAEQFTNAVRQLKTTTFTMNLTIDLAPGTGTLTGTTDPAKKRGAFTATTRGHGLDHTSIEWRMIGTSLYSSTVVDGKPANAQRPWRRLDNTTAAGLIDAFDAAQLAQALTKATNIHRTGGTHFTGTLDNATAAAAFGLRPLRSRTGSSSASPVTFTADLDAQSRLIGYQANVTVSNGSRRKATFAFSDFGVAVTVQPPESRELASTTAS